MPTLYGRFTRVDLADGVLVAMADDTTVRVTPADVPAVQRAAALAADVARLERANADLRRLALATAMERDQRTSDLSVVTSERDRLRAELDRQAAHRAAGDAVDLAAAVRERLSLRPELAALATMIRRTLRAWDTADAGAEVLPLKRTGGAR